jgi:hypothetical protein
MSKLFCREQAGTMFLKRSPCIWLCVAGLALALAGTAAIAQETKQDAKKDSDVFRDIGRWFDRSMTSIGDQFRDAGKGIDNFNQEAGVAAKSTAGAAADAAGAVARLPNTRMVSGRQDCPISDNGSPDCSAAANRLCQVKGMKSGTSLEVTSARDCPTRALFERGARAQCRDVTFVTRAMCQ